MTVSSFCLKICGCSTRAGDLCLLAVCICAQHGGLDSHVTRPSTMHGLLQRHHAPALPCCVMSECAPPCTLSPKHSLSCVPHTVLAQPCMLMHLTLCLCSSLTSTAKCAPPTGLLGPRPWRATPSRARNTSRPCHRQMHTQFPNAAPHYCCLEFATNCSSLGEWEGHGRSWTAEMLTSGLKGVNFTCGTAV